MSEEVTALRDEVASLKAQVGQRSIVLSIRTIG
jgi:hypothetical protein